MKPTTIRLPGDLLEELDAEADEHDFHTRTEYLRYLIDHRDLVVSIALEQRKTRVDSLADRVDDLEDRLADIEADEPDEPAPEPGESVEPADPTAAAEAPATGETEPSATPGGDGEPAPRALETIPDVDEGADAPDPLDLDDPEPAGAEQRARDLDFFAPTREIRHQRETAVVAAWETLVEYGELTREDFLDLVFEDHTAAFSSFEGWYERLVVPALEEFDDVERADEDTWRYAGEAERADGAEAESEAEVEDQ